MAFRFHDLPLDLCREVLWTWIAGDVDHDIQQIHTLDVAFCNHNQRKQYLSWIRDMPLHLKVPCVDNMLQLTSWITKRSLRIQEVYVHLTENPIEEVCHRFLLLDRLLVRAQAIHVLDRVSDSTYLFLMNLLSLAPVVQRLSILLPCQAKHLTFVLEHLPNPQLLRSLSTLWSVTHEQQGGAEAEEEAWWTKAPHLTEIFIRFGQTLPVDIFYHLSRALPHLEQMRIMVQSQTEYLTSLPPPLAPLQFTQLTSLIVLNLRCPAEVFLALLRGCPSLVKLTLSHLEFTHSLYQQEALTLLLNQVVPQLQYFQWEHRFPVSSGGSEFTLTLIAPEGELFSSEFGHRRVLPTDWLDSAHPWTAPVLLLDLLPMEDIGTLSLRSRLSLQIVLKGTEDDELSFWTTHARDLQRGTSLVIGRATVCTATQWITLLSAPLLTALKLGSDGVDFEAGVAACAASAVQSQVSKLRLTLRPLSAQSDLARLLLPVFPNLTTLLFRKDDLTAEELLLLLRLPKLTELEVGDGIDRSDSSLRALDAVDTDSWAEAATSTVCQKLCLLDIAIELWPAVRRLIDSTMGRKLVTVQIFPIDRWDEGKWKELQSKEAAYLSCRGRCRVSLCL